MPNQTQKRFFFLLHGVNLVFNTPAHKKRHRKVDAKTVLVGKCCVQNTFFSPVLGVLLGDFTDPNGVLNAHPSVEIFVAYRHTKRVTAEINTASDYRGNQQTHTQTQK
jgi:hypothetical protein